MLDNPRAQLMISTITLLPGEVVVEGLNRIMVQSRKLLNEADEAGPPPEAAAAHAKIMESEAESQRLWKAFHEHFTTVQIPAMQEMDELVEAHFDDQA